MLTSLFSALFISTNVAAKTIAPNHEHLSYEGRIDFTNEASPVIIWQGSSVSTALDGAKLELEIGFKDLSGQVYFDLHVNKKVEVIKAENGWIKPSLTLKKRKNTIKLIKRSEASAGHVAFLGFKVDDKASSKTLKKKHRKRYMFYGDSITVGACNEDGPEDQWEDFSTHNSLLSYAAIASAKLKADFRSIAISGVGISAGYKDYTAGQIWNRYYPDPTSLLASPQDWAPQVVFLNYGENDDSFTKKDNNPFPADYTKNYIALVENMRKIYPESHIVLLRGGMGGGATSEPLIKAWTQVVESLEKRDSKIHHYVFKHWYHLHPRVKDHRIMAKELIRWVKKQKLD